MEEKMFIKRYWGSCILRMNKLTSLPLLKEGKESLVFFFAEKLRYFKQMRRRLTLNAE